MATSSAIGRTRLLDAAERLMAERGVNAVSLREITAAAGQRNASGVQYHFGNRAGLIAAVIGRHMTRVDAERNTLLDALEAERRTGVHDVVAALVLPLVGALTTASGRRYLRIIDELVDDPAALAPGADVSALNRSLERAGRLLAPTLRSLPVPVRAARRDLCTTFLLRALSARARAIEQAERLTLGDADFAANLIDVLAAGLAVAPTRAARRSAGRT